MYIIKPIFVFYLFSTISPIWSNNLSSNSIKMSSVKVAVRVRPFNNREITRASSCIIEMEGNQTRKLGRFIKKKRIYFLVLNELAYSKLLLKRTQGQEVEFHEIKIQLFHEIKITIMRSKLDLITRSKFGLNIWQVWSGGQHFNHEIEFP